MQMPQEPTPRLKIKEAITRGPFPCGRNNLDEADVEILLYFLESRRKGMRDILQFNKELVSKFKPQLDALRFATSDLMTFCANPPLENDAERYEKYIYAFEGAYCDFKNTLWNELAFLKKAPKAPRMHDPFAETDDDIYAKTPNQLAEIAYHIHTKIENRLIKPMAHIFESNIKAARL